MHDDAAPPVEHGDRAERFGVDPRELADHIGGVVGGRQLEYRDLQVSGEAMRVEYAVR
jgi:hypothetical protein